MCDIVNDLLRKSASRISLHISAYNFKIKAYVRTPGYNEFISVESFFPISNKVTDNWSNPLAGDLYCYNPSFNLLFAFGCLHRNLQKKRIYWNSRR